MGGLEPPQPLPLRGPCVAIFAYVSQDKVNFLMISLIVLVTVPWWRLGHDRLRETEKSELSSVSVAQSTKAFRSRMLFVCLKFSCWRTNACIFSFCILLEMMKRGKWFRFCQPCCLVYLNKKHIVCRTFVSGQSFRISNVRQYQKCA